MKRWGCNYLTQHLGVLAPLLAKMENCGGTWTFRANLPWIGPPRSLWGW